LGVYARASEEEGATSGEASGPKMAKKKRSLALASGVRKWKPKG